MYHFENQLFQNLENYFKCLLHIPNNADQLTLRSHCAFFISLTLIGIPDHNMREIKHIFMSQ